MRRIGKASKRSRYADVVIVSKSLLSDEETQVKKFCVYQVLPLMKTLTFNIICALLFGIERGARREKLVDWFQEMIEGMWSIPINLPFTRYNRSLQASASIRNMMKHLIGEKRRELAKKGVNPHKDLISCMLSTRDENNREVIDENEIMDNVMLVMTAGHDTSSVLITFLVRILANDPSIYAAILKGIHDL